MAPSSCSSTVVSDQISRRTSVLGRHLLEPSNSVIPSLERSICLQYSPPEVSSRSDFDVHDLRRIMDGHNLEDRDWIFGLMLQSNLFRPKNVGGKVFIAPDYTQTMEQQRDMTRKRIAYLSSRGVFDGWLTSASPELDKRKLAVVECLACFDHSLMAMVGVQFSLWAATIKFCGTKVHHDNWLEDSEKYLVRGCFALSELGHGSNVKGIETVTTYDPKTQEFIINTPCESAQKYWIGGAAHDATHAVVFSQLHINGSNRGVHALIAQIRDADGNICPNIRIADCGHKMGLNGIDNGRIWFDNVRVPRENLLNLIAEVSPDGQYLSTIEDPDQRFSAVWSSLTSSRGGLTGVAIHVSKISLAIAIRYSLTRRAFSISPNGPEVLLLDYPSHQRRLLPLLAKTCAMSCANNYLKDLYANRTPEIIKTYHILSTAFKSLFTWHNIRTLQECREACGGQGLLTDNRIGILKSEFDVQTTFEGDNNVLLHQVGKILLSAYMEAQKKKHPFNGLGVEYISNPSPVLPAQLTSGDLRSSQFQAAVLCLREQDLLNRLAAEVSQYQEQGGSKEYAAVQSFQLAEDLARAFAERVVFQTFLETEMKSSGPLKNVLGLLRSMYAMITLEEDASFLRNGYLSPNNAVIARKEVVKLCSELRPHALSIVSSFGIPDALLGPIAFDWVEANSWSSVQRRRQSLGREGSYDAYLFT